MRRRRRRSTRGLLTIRDVDTVDDPSVLFDVKGKVKRKMYPRKVCEDVYAPVSPYAGAETVLTFQIEDSDTCIDVVCRSLSLAYFQSIDHTVRVGCVRFVV